MRRHRSLLPLLIPIALLAGCAGAPERPSPTTPSPVAPLAERDQRALDAAERADYLTAAREYSKLAATVQPPDRYRYQLRAAEAFLNAGHTGPAHQILAALDAEALTPVQRLRRRILQARVDLQERRPDAVLDGLAEQPAATAPEGLRADYHRLRAEAFHMIGNHLESTRERVRLEPLLTDDETRERNHEAIWRSLSMLRQRVLLQLRTAPPPDPLSGWLELAHVAKAYQQRPLAMQERLNEWQRDYPGHPAAQAIVPRLMSRREEDVRHPGHIALLLPLEGRFAPAAAAVRDGFLAAYYDSRRHGADTTRVQIYDSHERDIEELYDEAVTAGADFVVGPLQKEAVARLGNIGELPVPVLALNHVDLTAVSENFFQFSLSPEAEARQVAERLWQDGFARSAVMTPKGDWGDRVFAAFRERWEQIGGTIITEQSYALDARDYALPVRRLLNVDDSQDRYRKLRRDIGANLHFEARRRDDIDVVFMTGFPRQVRQLRPQLRFYDAGELPVYATSHVFSGQRDPSMDRDMDGILFCDMPWVLGGGDETTVRLRRAVETHLGSASGSRFERLYALGADAFGVLPVLPPLARYPYERYEGATGSLYLDERRRLRRELLWARFDGGIPRLLAPTSLGVDGGS